MRESYEKIRKEIEEIVGIFKKKMIEDDSIMDCDPDLIILMARCFNLMNASDKFTMACIETMENQNEKLDRIINMLNRN